MTEQNEAHFELHDANKDKLFQEKKRMKNIKDFFANQSKVMLVDGDLLAYRITSSLEEPVEWEDDVWTLWSDLKRGKQLFLQSVGFYMGLTKSRKAIICFSDKNNFRKQLDSKYKSFRKKIRKPICYKPLRKWIESTRSWKLHIEDKKLGAEIKRRSKKTYEAAMKLRKQWGIK